MGGYTGSTGFGPATNSEKNRQSFVKYVIKFLRDRDLDGVDLDWEFPSASQKDQLSQVKKLMANDSDSGGMRKVMVQRKRLGTEIHIEIIGYQRGL